MDVTILVVEDEPKIARLLELELSHEGYRVQIAYDGVSGFASALNPSIDLILLDIMLPGQSGTELLRKLRRECDTPVIILTARGDISDMVSGLDLGADDYIIKPYRLEELLARIRSALRRAALRREPDGKRSEIFSLDDLAMDVTRHTVQRGGCVIDLTKREFDLLECLLRNQDIVLSRDQIIEQVWGYDFEGDSNVVDVYIGYLRAKVDAAGQRKLIHTVRGVGYCARLSE